MKDKEVSVMAQSKNKRWIAAVTLSVVAVAALSCAAVFIFNGIGQKAQSPVSVSDETEAEPDDAMDQRYYAAERDMTFTGSYRNMLVGDELMVYDAMKPHFIVERRNDKLTVAFTSGKGYKNVEAVSYILENAYNCFMGDYPEVYWVNYYQKFVTRNEQKLIDTATMDFRKQDPDLYDQVDTMFDNIDLAVERIKKSRRSESRYDTARAAHDYICWNISYDWGIVNHDELRDFTYLAAPLFGVGNRGRRFVSSGYAEAFRVLCNRLDIPCIYTEGNFDFGPTRGIMCRWRTASGTVLTSPGTMMTQADRLDTPIFWPETIPAEPTAKPLPKCTFRVIRSMAKSSLI